MFYFSVIINLLVYQNIMAFCYITSGEGHSFSSERNIRKDFSLWYRLGMQMFDTQGLLLYLHPQSQRQLALLFYKASVDPGTMSGLMPDSLTTLTCLCYHRSAFLTASESNPLNTFPSGWGILLLLWPCQASSHISVPDSSGKRGIKSFVPSFQTFSLRKPWEYVVFVVEGWSS